jgi:DNA-binding FrmR family transcriptional regulator
MKHRLSAELHAKIDKRLQRLEGQVRGVRRMLDEDRDCPDVLTQLAAIRGAAQQISLLLVESYAVECVNNPESHTSTDEAISKMVNILGKLS